jgi:hypothetical protein
MPLINDQTILIYGNLFVKGSKSILCGRAREAKLNFEDLCIQKLIRPEP